METEARERVWKVDGTSHQVCELRSQIQNFNDKAIQNILIVGPRGSGKEHVARLLNEINHSRSFIYVKCSQIPSYPDGMFFGYTDDAMSPDPKVPNVGLVRAAVGGDLYLDGIEKLSLTAQKRLIRLFTDRRYSRVGDHISRIANVRIIAATEANLEERCNEKLFSRELYSKLSSHVIHTIPLSRRREDIPWLIHKLLVLQFSSKITISDELLNYLQSLPWSRNVDELKQVLADTYLNAKQRGSTELGLEDLPKLKLTTDIDYLLPSQRSEVTKCSLSGYLGASEKIYWIKAFELFEGNASRLSSETGIPLSTINYKIKQFKLRKIARIQYGQ